MGIVSDLAMPQCGHVMVETVITSDIGVTKVQQDPARQQTYKR